MMINDKSQGSVAPYLRRGGPLTTTLLQICCLVFFQAILKIGWQLTFSEAMGKKVDFLLCTNQLKDKLARHPTYGDQEQFSQHRPYCVWDWWVLLDTFDSLTDATTQRRSEC